MKSMIIIAGLVAVACAAPSKEVVEEARSSGVINLSSFMSSDYAIPLLVIGAILVFDVFAGVAYFGERNKNRRRYYSVAPIRPYYGYNRRYYGNGVGRIGDADVDNESSQFAFQSLDLVDTTFGLMNVESAVCRERAICELERAAGKNAFFGFVVQNLNSYINGLEKYESAIQKGLNGQSCEEIYAECPYSIGESWKLFKRR